MVVLLKFFFKGLLKTVPKKPISKSVDEKFFQNTMVRGLRGGYQKSKFLHTLRGKLKWLG